MSLRKTGLTVEGGAAAPILTQAKRLLHFSILVHLSKLQISAAEMLRTAKNQVSLPK
jgi:hypothetical protein